MKNDWIGECKGPWRGQIELAEKPQQYHIENIEDFVWRMCVLYRGLNRVIRPLEYPIPRCDDAISIIAVGASMIYIITIHVKQGYQQVTVCKLHREIYHFLLPITKGTPPKSCPLAQ